MDVFTALESIQLERQNRLGSQQYDEDIIAPMLRRAISVYEAGRAIVGFMTPDYDEVHKVYHLFITQSDNMLTLYQSTEKSYMMNIYTITICVHIDICLHKWSSYWKYILYTTRGEA